MDTNLENKIARVLALKDMGKNFFEALTSEFGHGWGDLLHIKLNGEDAIITSWADAVMCYKEEPYVWDMKLVQALASEFLMKVVVLKKYDCDTDWNITEDFDDIDDSKGLDVMSYFKDIDDATVFDTVDDVEEAYNEYTDNIKDKYAFDNDILLEELTKAQKGKDKIINAVKSKDPSEFVMIWNDDADSYEVKHKFSTIIRDGFNQVNYTIGLFTEEE